MKHMRVAAPFALLLFGSACGITEQPERAYDVVGPRTQPVRTITSFTESLVCMDNLFAQYGIQDIVITSAGIPDATGRVKAGTKEMLISAISKMSVRSGAFTYVDFEQGQADVAELHRLIGFTDQFKVPKFYIRGGITQLDDSVLSESVGGGIALPNFEVSVSKDQIVSVIAVDLNLGYLPTRQIMPGVSSTNSVAVARKGLAGDAGATIDKAGLIFNISLNESEGPHQATRTLIELSAIELAGKLARVPYWRCLQIEQTNPEMVAEARSWYEAMSEQDRVTFVQRTLVSTGHFRGTVNGIHDAATKGAIARYQANNGLIANGRIDFQLYQSVISQDLALGVQPTPVEPLPQEAAVSVPLTINLDTPKGRAPIYAVNEKLRLEIATSQDSYVYCYYRDDEGQIARIFPNRFDPDPYSIAGRPFVVPGKGSTFDIVFETAGTEEEILCLASLKEVGLRLPDSLKVADLTPLSIESLDDVVKAFETLDPSGLAQARLPLQVGGSS